MTTLIKIGLQTLTYDQSYINWPANLQRLAQLIQGIYINSNKRAQLNAQKEEQWKRNIIIHEETCNAAFRMLQDFSPSTNNNDTLSPFPTSKIIIK